MNEVLKFIALELFEKIYRLKQFISSNNSENDNSNENVILIFHQTLSRIIHNLEKLLLQIDNSTKDEYFVIQRKLGTCYSAINKLHQKLNYLDTEWLRPEIFTFVNHIIAYLPAERRPDLINVILSDNYNFLEKNLIKEFHEVVVSFSHDSTLSFSEKSPTVILPKIEYKNPLNWPILCHELGHVDELQISKLISQENLFPKGISISDKQNLKNWAEEIYCDFFATNIIGPAYFLSLSTFGILNSLYSGTGSSSGTHPSFALRMSLLYSYLDNNQLNIFVDGNPIHHIFNMMLNNVDEIILSYPGLERKETEIKGLNTFSNFLRSNYDNYKNIKFKIEKNQLENLNYLVAKLSKRIPIGSCRDDSHDNANFEILSTEQKRFKNKQDEAYNEFLRIRNSLTERKTELWEILNAGWIYKYTELIPLGMKIFFENSSLTINEKIDKYGNELDILDDRLLISIETSKLIQYIEN